MDSNFLATHVLWFAHVPVEINRADLSQKCEYQGLLRPDDDTLQFWSIILRKPLNAKLVTATCFKRGAGGLL